MHRLSIDALFCLLQQSAFIPPFSYDYMTLTNHDRVNDIQQIISFLLRELFIYYKLSCNWTWSGEGSYKNLKRFYTRGTLRGIRISQLAKIPFIYRDWLRTLNKRVNYLSCIKGKGSWKTFTVFCIKYRALCFSIIKSPLRIPFIPEKPNRKYFRNRTFFRSLFINKICTMYIYYLYLIYYLDF